MTVKLSILIPTYNRPDKVLDRINELLPQLSKDIEVIVVDNASGICVKSHLVKNLGELPDNIKIYRNLINVGAGPNMCKSFEYAIGEWSWILGDDDHVKADAIEIIKINIKKYSEKHSIKLVCFSSEICSYKEDYVIRSTADLWDNIKYSIEFSNFLFISTKVVKTSSFVEHLRVAYQFCYSAGAHVAVFMSIIANNNSAVFSKESVVSWNAPDSNSTWNNYQVAAGITSLVEVIGCEKEVFHHISQGLELFLWDPFLKGGLYLLLIDATRPVEYWYVQYNKFSLYLHGKKWFSANILMIICRVLIVFPKSKNCIKFLLSPFCAKMKSATAGIERN